MNKSRDRLRDLFQQMETNPAITCPSQNIDAEDCETCKYNISDRVCNTIERKIDFLLENGVIVPPCKVGDKVAVRALCECVATIPDYYECRNICPFEDDCECEDCDNANERIFNTEISSIFNDGFGWKVTFKNLIILEADFADMGTSFFVGENAEQQAKEAEKALKARANNE